MITVYADEQVLHDGRAELTDGQLLPCFEQPRRALMIRDRVREVGLGSIVPPEDQGRGPIERVHAPAFVDVLATAWERWAVAVGCCVRQSSRPYWSSQSSDCWHFSNWTRDYGRASMR